MANEHLERAIALAGGQAPLARKLTDLTGREYKQGHVWAWLNRYELPPEVVIPIESVVGGEVTRHQLRPDIYPVEDGAAA